MQNNDYERVKQECWEEYHKRVVCGTDAPQRLFNKMFAKAYILGQTKAFTNERLQVAAMAMQGILGSRAWMKALIREIDPEGADADDKDVIPLIASKAVECADALLNELNKEKVCQPI